MYIQALYKLLIALLLLDLGQLALAAPTPNSFTNTDPNSGPSDSATHIAPRANAASTAMRQACSSISKFNQSHSSFLKYPSGGEIKYRDANWVKYNPCKSKTGGICVPGFDKGKFKKCKSKTGEVCIPGFDKGTIKVPDGIQVKYKTVSYWSLIQKAGLGEVLKKANQACKCLPDVGSPLPLSLPFPDLNTIFRFPWSAPISMTT